MHIHAPFGGVFGAHFSQMMSLIVLTPKRTILRLNHVIWAINRENWSRGSSWVLVREKNGQDRTGKMSQKGYISPICWEAPTEAMYMKICVVGYVLDVITCAKFQGLQFYRGSNFPFFLLILNGPYYTGCSAIALPVIRSAFVDCCNTVCLCSPCKNCLMSYLRQSLIVFQRELITSLLSFTCNIS